MASQKAIIEGVRSYLNARGIYDEADEDLIKEYAQHLTLATKARRQINKEGLTVPGIHGPKAHPALTTLNQILSNVARLAAVLGLGAAARKRLEATGKIQNDNPWED